MATYTNSFTQVDAGGNLIRRGTIALSSSYSTGGETITAANVGVGAIKGTPDLQSVAGYVPEWSATKLKVRVMNTGLELASGYDLSSISFPARFTGIPID